MISATSQWRMDCMLTMVEQMTRHTEMRVTQIKALQRLNVLYFSGMWEHIGISKAA